MPKRLRDYFFKIKSPRPRPRPQIQLPSSKSWNILSGCKNPRTPSFAIYSGRNEREREHVHVHVHVPDNDDNNIIKDDAATLADIDRFLLENFRSLYLKDDEETEDTKRVLEEEGPKQGSILYDESCLETPRHLGGSTRLLVKRGFSGSLAEDNTLTSGSNSTISTQVSSSWNSCEKDQALPDNSIALLTHSTNPCHDFRRSMQEMVNHHGSLVDWDFMEDLLFCYLNLNHKNSHKFILSAFVDLITVMRRSSQPTPHSVRTIRSREITR